MVFRNKDVEGIEAEYDHAQNPLAYEVLKDIKPFEPQTI
jgi:hypothetical protein